MGWPHLFELFGIPLCLYLMNLIIATLGYIRSFQGHEGHVKAAQIPETDSGPRFLPLRIGDFPDVRSIPSECLSTYVVILNSM